MFRVRPIPRLAHKQMGSQKPHAGGYGLSLSSRSSKSPKLKNCYGVARLSMNTWIFAWCMFLCLNHCCVLLAFLCTGPDPCSDSQSSGSIQLLLQKLHFKLFRRHLLVRRWEKQLQDSRNYLCKVQCCKFW